MTMDHAGEAIPETGGSPTDLETVDQGFDYYKELRKCPVQHSDALGGFYWLSRYKDVRAAALNKQFSSSVKGINLPPDMNAPRLYALEQEAPDHMPAKLLYMEALKPDLLKALEPQLVAMTNAQIDTFASAGECDLMKDFAEPLPVRGMCAAVGVSGLAVERFRGVASRFGESPESRGQVIEELGSLVIDELMARRAQPRDDYLTRIANAELEGHKMDEGELARFMIGFFIAGHETTTSSLGTLLFHVLRRPDLRERVLDDVKLLEAAVEEAVRIQPPFHAFHRTTTEAVEVDGMTIPADATVRLCYAAANRDPEAYERPDEFDPERDGPPHLGFGFGRHVCAGSALARLEMRIAVQVLLTRLPDIRMIVDDLDYKFFLGSLACPKSCPAVFTPR